MIDFDAVRFSGSAAECEALNAQWRALRQLIAEALPEALVLEIQVQVSGGFVRLGVRLYGAEYMLLDLEPMLDHWDRLLAVSERLGPGWYALSRLAVVRLMSSK